MKRLLLLLALVALTATSDLYAQRTDLAVGDYIRLSFNAPTVSTRPIVGRVVAIGADTLGLRSNTGQHRIAFAQVERLEVRRSMKRHLWQGALVGSLAGGLGTALLFPECKEGDSDSHEGSERAVLCVSLLFTKLIAIPVGIVGGALVGTAIGSQIRKERWKSLPVDVSVGVTPAGSGGVVLRLRF